MVCHMGPCLVGHISDSLKVVKSLMVGNAGVDGVQKGR